MFMLLEESRVCSFFFFLVYKNKSNLLNNEGRKSKQNSDNDKQLEIKRLPSSRE